ncbi:MAG: hypothetical protein DRZ76_02245 [Candidatus Nealsonbacteria bacterium]|nr:MAG: hypothetical protein DRZ76_02245 [Candidatus Nealsonbacteria bacterium]
MKEIYLSVIIPAYNEGKNISKTLDVVSKYLNSQPYSYEIIVVSDGSTDDTVKVVQEKAKLLPNVFVVDRKRNRGKGYTVKEGMLEANGNIRLFTDADNSTDISHFEKMRPLFDSGYDVVIGSRDPKDAPGARQAVPQPWHKRLLGNLGNLFVQLVAVRGIWDTQCGFKAFRHYAAEKIFSQTKINRWGFDIEALALARKFGYKIGIIPVNWINNPESRVKFSSYFQVLWETIKIRWNLYRHKYNI